VFALMAVRDIRSIEQLKHVRREEAGRLLGLGRLPALDTLWGWFHEVAGKSRAGTLLKEFFADQIRCGLVAVRLWFTRRPSLALYRTEQGACGLEHATADADARTDQSGHL
jgi:hypothetical protein